MRKKLLVLPMVLLMLLAGGGLLLLPKKAESSKQETVVDGCEPKMAEETENQNIEPNEEVRKALESGDETQIQLACLSQYKEINPETAGIISIPGTVLNHPLMCSAKNEGFYLSHDLFRQPNANGIPFMTGNSSFGVPGGNTIIYGHNIRYGRKDVFYPLSGYEKLDYYRQHPIIEIYTDEGKEDYLVFAYYLVDTSDEDAFVYWEKTKFTGEGEFNEYMKEVERRNWLITGIPVSAEDEYITLSSCSMELTHSGTNRMVVMARKKRAGDEEEEYLAKAAMNPSPYLPRKLRENTDKTTQE